MVVLPEGVISSRKGNAPNYDDVRDMVLTRATEIIAEKNPELPAEARDRIARQIGIGSLKYAMLARDNNKTVTFDLDEALSFDGHAAPYIQYAHARACRILENGKDRSETVQFTELAPEELALLQLIALLPEEIQRAAEQYRPLLIANYVYDVAKAFSDFYHACPVLQSEEPTRSARLALVDATRQTLANGLALLGIDAPEAM
jgi:arginyl-tRNA synthetase